MSGSSSTHAAANHAANGLKLPAVPVLQTGEEKKSEAPPPTIQKKQEGESSPQAPFKQPPNQNTGMPDGLRSGIEKLSGFSMGDVRVNYNSDKPAQLQAHAYAQGSEIHVAPGQEKHLPHEAWHVVQQKQGRVKPTLQAKGVSVNDDTALEKEADTMGQKAIQRYCKPEACNGVLPTAQAGMETSTAQLISFGKKENGGSGTVVQPKFIADSAPVNETEVSKETFLSSLRDSVEQVGSEVLAEIDQTIDECPYIPYWFNYYEGKDAAHIEAAIVKYAPGVTGAKDWREAIAIISDRIRIAFKKNIATGSLAGVPDDMPDLEPAGRKPVAQLARAEYVIQRCGSAVTDDREGKGEAIEDSPGLRSAEPTEIVTKMGNPKDREANEAKKIAALDKFGRESFDKGIARLTKLNAEAKHAGGDEKKKVAENKSLTKIDETAAGKVITNIEITTQIGDKEKNETTWKAITQVINGKMRIASFTNNFIINNTEKTIASMTAGDNKISPLESEQVKEKGGGAGPAKTGTAKGAAKPGAETKSADNSIPIRMNEVINLQYALVQQNIGSTEGKAEAKDSKAFIAGGGVQLPFTFTRTPLEQTQLGKLMAARTNDEKGNPTRKIISIGTPHGSLGNMICMERGLPANNLFITDDGKTYTISNQEITNWDLGAAYTPITPKPKVPVVPGAEVKKPALLAPSAASTSAAASEVPADSSV